MCTKWFSAGEVHKYFNPYGSPYEAFINYMNVLSDFMIRVDEDALAMETVLEKADLATDKETALARPVKTPKIKATKVGAKTKTVTVVKEEVAKAKVATARPAAKKAKSSPKQVPSTEKKPKKNSK